ncbi:hypothetical protein GDO78_008407 [Eleutherodactylus coqui]|uniref:Uncharacterized protein n=1 Tax=Eleutherodactylus coqui TaxID=57060 RepID=A0A8J6FBJ7_ELECQ|nr:hypothetical protein GDO78_008407 [Eleutherodactylus coqui]
MTNACDQFLTPLTVVVVEAYSCFYRRTAGAMGVPQRFFFSSLPIYRNSCWPNEHLADNFFICSNFVEVI